jgi:hypothetical protein
MPQSITSYSLYSSRAAAIDADQKPPVSMHGKHEQRYRE